jgi:predicted ArsR family transcriptional regulator
MPSNRSTSDIRDRVLTWRNRGWSAYRIAEKLGVTPQTVYYHLHALEDEGTLENGVKQYRPRSAS